LDAGLPVALHLGGGTTAGHEVVCDGYGFNFESLYHHLNMGWSGFDDAWYNLSEVEPADTPCSWEAYDCTYNIDPTITGEIISGRITYLHGNPAAGVTVTAAGPSVHTATTNQRGIFAIKGLPSNTVWNVSHSGVDNVYGPAQVSVTMGASSDNRTIGNVIVDDFQAPGGFVITRQPENKLAGEGTDATLSVTATVWGNIKELT
jgi:hypothetical protein